jgi:AcrR family transcriptional regulator
MNGYEKRTYAKRERIIDIARELFVLRGMQDVSISEIAKQAKVSQVTIYNYFGDKNSLAKEVFASYIEAAIDKYRRIIDGELPFIEKLKYIMQDKSSMVKQIELSDFSSQALSDNILQKVFQDAVKEQTLTLYRSFIEQGKVAGAIRPDIQTEAIMSYMMTSMELFRSFDFLATSSTYKKGMMDLFLHGIIQK